MPKKVLIVEDEPVPRKQLVKHFQSLGADGLSLLHEIRQRDSETIVVVLSANVTAEVRRQALTSRATRVLEKPQSLDELACLLLGSDVVAS